MRTIKSLYFANAAGLNFKAYRVMSMFKFTTAMRAYIIHTHKHTHMIIYHRVSFFFNQHVS